MGRQILVDANTIRASRLFVNDTEVTDAIEEIATLDGLTSSVAELNLVDNQPASVTFVVGAEVSDIINVAGQVKDAAGTDMANPCALKFYLADDSAGLDPSTTAPAQGISIGTDGALIEHTDNLSGVLITEADGDFDINIENQTTTLTFYLVMIMPNGSLQISDAITFA